MSPGLHTLQVEIGPQPDRLLWNRCFDDRQGMVYTFLPVCVCPEGLSLEQSGPVQLGGAIEMIDGG